MRTAAPITFDPVGRLLSKLPFANALVASRLIGEVWRLLEGDLEGAPSAPTSKATVMLHLRTQTGTVLLEMEAKVILDKSAPMVVLSGREVDPGLCGFITCEGEVKIEDGTISVNSSVTMPTFDSQESESSLYQTRHGWSTEDSAVVVESREQNQSTRNIVPTQGGGIRPMRRGRPTGQLDASSTQPTPSQISSEDVDQQRGRDRWLEACSPHARSPHTHSPHARSPHARSPRARSPHPRSTLSRNSQQFWAGDSPNARSTNSQYYDLRSQPHRDALPRNLFACDQSDIPSDISSLMDVYGDDDVTHGSSRSQIGHTALSRVSGVQRVLPLQRVECPPFLASAAPVSLVCMRDDDGVFVGTRLDVGTPIDPETRLPISGDPRVTIHEGVFLRACPSADATRYPFVRAIGESFLRVSSKGTSVPSWHLVGHDGHSKETDELVLASGEIEVDTRGALVRWMVTPYPLEPSEPDVDNDFDSIPMLRAWEYVDESCVHLAGQSGLPFDRLWMWLRVSSLSEWLPEEHSDLLDYLLDLNGTCMVDSVHVTWPSEMHADPNLRPPIEVSGDFCLLKASAVSDGTLNEALATARDYIVAKRALRALEAANPDTTANPAVLGALAAARTRMRDMYALRTIRQASRERKVASNLLGFTRAAKQRSVSYERLYPKLRLILLALRDEQTLIAQPGVPVEHIISFLIPWRPCAPQASCRMPLSRVHSVRDQERRPEPV